MLALRALLAAATATLAAGSAETCTSGVDSVTGGFVSGGWATSPVELWDGVKTNPDEKIYTFMNTPDYLLGGRYISSSAWPGQNPSSWQLTITYTAPAMLYVWVSDDPQHNAGLDESLGALGFGLEAWDNDFARNFNDGNPRALKVWGRWFESGTELIVDNLSGLGVVGVVSTCDPPTTTTTTYTDTSTTITSTTTTSTSTTTISTSTWTTSSSTSTTTITETTTKTTTSATLTTTSTTETTTTSTSTTTSRTTTSTTETSTTETTTTETSSTSTYTGSTSTVTTSTGTATTTTWSSTTSSSTTSASTTTSSTTASSTTSSSTTTVSSTTTSGTTTTTSTTTRTRTTTTRTTTTKTVTTTTKTTTSTTITTTSTSTPHRQVQIEGMFYFDVDDQEALLQALADGVLQLAIEYGVSDAIGGLSVGLVTITGAVLGEVDPCVYDNNRGYGCTTTTTTTAPVRRLRDARQLSAGTVTVLFEVRISRREASNYALQSAPHIVRTFTSSEAAIRENVMTQMAAAVGAAGIVVSDVRLAPGAFVVGNTWSNEQVSTMSPEEIAPSSNPEGQQEDAASGGWIIILIVSIIGIIAVSIAIPLGMRRCLTAKKAPAQGEEDDEEDFNVDPEASPSPFDDVGDGPKSPSAARFRMRRPVSFGVDMKNGGDGELGSARGSVGPPAAIEDAVTSDQQPSAPSVEERRATEVGAGWKIEEEPANCGDGFRDERLDSMESCDTIVM